MNITNVNVTRVDSDSKLAAVASVTIDNAIKIHGFKVIAGEKGYFVSMPSRPDKNGEYRDAVYPVTPAARKQLIEAVLDEFTKDRLERGNTPDLEDTKLPWEEKDGFTDKAEPPEPKIDTPEDLQEMIEAKQNGSVMKAEGKVKTADAKGKESIKDQLAEISKSGEKQLGKTAKAMKANIKEEITI